MLTERRTDRPTDGRMGKPIQTHNVFSGGKTMPFPIDLFLSYRTDSTDSQTI